MPPSWTVEYCCQQDHSLYQPYSEYKVAICLDLNKVYKTVVLRLHNPFFFTIYVLNSSCHLSAMATLAPLRDRWDWLPWSVWCWWSVWHRLSVWCWGLGGKVWLNVLGTWWGRSCCFPDIQTYHRRAMHIYHGTSFTFIFWDQLALNKLQTPNTPWKNSYGQSADSFLF